MKTKLAVAIGAASSSKHEKFKVGAAIFRRNKLVSTGYNKNKTHPASTHPYCRIHAELAALINARQDVKGCDMFVARIRKDGETALAKPCKYCMALLLEYGIRVVSYTTNDGVGSINVQAKSKFS
jgi:deoxycytidylate deaminase